MTNQTAVSDTFTQSELSEQEEARLLAEFKADFKKNFIPPPPSASQSEMLSYYEVIRTAVMKMQDDKEPAKNVLIALDEFKTQILATYPPTHFTAMVIEDIKSWMKDISNQKTIVLQ